MNKLRALALTVSALLLFLLSGCATNRPPRVMADERVPMPPPPPDQVVQFGPPPAPPAVKPLPPPIPTRDPSTVVVPPVHTVPPAPREAVSYTIKSGETLSVIAARNKMTTRELAEFNRIADPNRVRAGQTILIPAKGAALVAPVAPVAHGSSVTRATASAPAAAAGGTYVVQSGDSLSVIARRNNTTVAAIKQLNNLTSDRVLVGQTLRLPGASPAGDSAAPRATPAPTATRAPDAVTVTPRATPTPPPLGPAVLEPRPAPTAAAHAATPDPVAAKAFPIVVEPGETLEDIARSYLFTVEEIRRLNNLPPGAEVKPGDRLLIPPTSY